MVGRVSVAPFLGGAAACLLLIAAVSFTDYNKVIDLEAAAQSAALVQTGKGLSLTAKVGKWDISSSKGDARLSDQIAGWTKGKAELQSKPAAARTQELADTDLKPKPSLTQQMHTAADSLRLSDFLSGVTPETTQQQVESLYSKMDPKDVTGWKERDAAIDPKPTKKAQVKEISKFQSELQNQLSTTANMDSPHAQKVRSELKELLAKRAELKARIQAKEARKQREVHARQISDDQDDDVLKVLSRTEDSSSTYHKWLRDASAGSRGKEEQERAVKKPVITAGGQLKWKQTGKSAVKSAEQLKASQARLQTLAERARKKELEQKKPAGARNADLVEEAEEREEGGEHSMQSIQERAAYKVNRWMGGGYVPVYDLGSGR